MSQTENDSSKIKRESMDEHIRMIPINELEREIERTKQMTEMSSEVRHIGQGMNELKAVNKELLSMIKSMQVTINETRNLSERMDKIEVAVSDLLTDKSERNGQKGLFDTLGVQAPFWLAMLAMLGYAILRWIEKDGG